VCFPIRRDSHRARVLADLELYLADNCEAWDLRPDGSYRRCTPGEGEPVSAQLALLETLAD
jgi:polyphosphate kinase